MRSTIAFQRITKQTGSPPVRDPVQIAFQAIVDAADNPPISESELREILREELGIVAVNSQECPVTEELKFNNIYDFASWYAVYQEKFSGPQRTALDTLLITRNGIDSGCACRRPSRDAAAHAYFGEFWTRNKQTDLLQAIARVANATRVSIEGICCYPSPA